MLFKTRAQVIIVLSLLLGMVLLQSACVVQSGRWTETPDQLTATAVAALVLTGTPEDGTTTPSLTPDSATVAISPTNGPPGTVVQVVARGFPPDTEVHLGMGLQQSEYDVVGTARTDSSGALGVSLNIPEFAESLERWVVVIAVPGGGPQGVSNVFQVTSLDSEPTVEVMSQVIAPGEEVDVVARGFPPNTSVEIGIGRVDSEYDVMAFDSTDDAGIITTSLIIPEFVEPEDQWVIVLATQDHAMRAFSSPLEVAEALFTNTYIYLIGLDEGARLGKEIGCGDSVVPIEIEIEPTIAPLTAALEYLLSLDSREYGNTGLYNSLYQSDLALRSINIVGEEAVIELSGTLKLGGACDAPRVEAQLRETALQYTTVERVSISINGVPLEDLLAGN